MDIISFKESVPIQQSIMGLDLGKVKIGLAISDQTQTIATPLEVYTRKNRKKDLEFIVNILQTESIGAIVCGLPLTLDGTENNNCLYARRFCQSIQECLTLPVWFQDERFTTKTSNESLKQLGIRRKKRDQIDDKIAATIILQSTLDRLKYLNC